ncbi:MAG TPA: hypothetical protein VFG72_10100 [Marmoricola sp.]|nr:hypothetical protein [Marmoricola sp.]
MADPSAWAGLASGVAGIVSAGVAGIAVVATSRNAKASLNAQRAIMEHQQSLELSRARENRLWEKRSDTYVDLLSWLRQVLAAVRDERRELQVPDMPSSIEDRVSAFASDGVVAGVLALREKLIMFGYERSEGLARTGQDTDDPQFRSWLATYQAARDEAFAAYNSLWDALRRELDPETPSGVI